MKTVIEAIREIMAKFSKDIKLEFALSKSFHATERQGRHGTEEDKFISDDEILETVKKCSKRIIEDIVNDNISIDDRFIVRDTNTDLNIVCQLHRGTNKDELRIDIVTVIRTEKFWNTKNNWVITIK